ncbi:hypothetical protein VZ228_03330, partial [Metamycoplasma hominis]
TREAFIDSFAKTLNILTYKVSFVKLEEKVNYEENIKYIEAKQAKQINNNAMWNNYYDLNIKDFSNLNKEAISNNFYLIVNGENLNDLNEYLEVIIDKFQDTGIGLEKLHKARLLTFL